MTSTIKFKIDGYKIWNEINRLDDQAQLSAANRFIQARKIEAWFRGIETRNHVRTLNAMAVVIQRYWRGYSTRRSATTFVVNRVNVMWKNHYGICATRIQAAWRGYRARKNGPQFKRIKEWLTSIYEKNELFQLQMQSFRKAQLEITRGRVDSQSLSWLLFILFKVGIISVATKQNQANPFCLVAADMIIAIHGVHKYSLKHLTIIA